MSRRQFAKALAVAACALALPVPLAGCSGSRGQESLSWQQGSWELLDTVVEARALTTPEVLERVRSRCEFLDGILSRTREGSDVWRVNAAGTEPVTVEPETARLIRLALEAGEESGGLFDISIGAVSCLWDFKAGAIPSEEEVSRALPFVGPGMVKVESGRVVKAHGRVKLDLGGIAKGFIADDVAGLLREAGCESALLNLGGNVMAVGQRPEGGPWRIGVQDPEGRGLLATAEVEDRSVVTAGLYERSFVRKGVRYGHILDPRTGYPAETDVASASILCPDSLTADWLSTAMFLLGRKAGLELLERKGVPGLLADGAGNLSQACGERFQEVER